MHGAGGERGQPGMGHSQCGGSVETQVSLPLPSVEELELAQGWGQMEDMGDAQILCHPGVNFRKGVDLVNQFSLRSPAN